jgi:hypothetical protein
VKNQEVTEKKRKAFQYSGKYEDNDEGNEISLVDKRKKSSKWEWKYTNYHQSAAKKDLREETCR